MRIAVAVGALLAGSMLGAAAPKPASAPYWTRRPTEAEFRAALPPEAQKAGGRAIMRCHVTASGGLEACVLLEETPSAMGFGRTLLSMSGAYQMSPQAMAKLPADRMVPVLADTFSYDQGPDWLRRPTQEELYVLWPTQAAKEGIGGRAVISCLVNIHGSAYDCVVLEESPPGKGFGGAAVGLSQQFQFRPAKLHGEAVVSTINVPINWERAESTAVTGGKRLLNPAIAWIESPTFDDVAAAYPKKARAAKLAGRANVDCEFARDGRVKNCRTVMEAPSGQGFGHAAEDIAKHFVSPVTTLDGKSISEYAVQIPIDFDPSVLEAGQPAVGTPKWAGLPSLTDTQAAFGEIMKSSTGTVRVVLTCKVQMGGGVGDCKAESELPTGQGVAQAAIALAPHFKLTTWTVEGLPTVGGTVRIPLRYEGEKAAASPAAPPPKP